MLTQMEVFTPGVTLPPLPIVDQAEALDLIQIVNIDGLGPVKATVNTTQYGSVDGETYDGSFTPKRNIVLTVKLNPDWVNYTYESLRQMLYLYFMPKNKVSLRFTSTHLSPMQIEGYVESFEPPLFEKDPEYQISIICPKPYFLSVSSIAATGVTIGLGEDIDTIVTYDGNVESGFVIDVTSDGSTFVGELRVINNTPALNFAIFTDVHISDAELFRMSTVQGNKYARHYPLPSGAYSSLLGNMDPTSNWLSLQKGENRIQVRTTVPGLNWSLSYYARYGGL